MLVEAAFQPVRLLARCDWALVVAGDLGGGPSEAFHAAAVVGWGGDCCGLP